MICRTATRLCSPIRRLQFTALIAADWLVIDAVWACAAGFSAITRKTSPSCRGWRLRSGEGPGQDFLRAQEFAGRRLLVARTGQGDRGSDRLRFAGRRKGPRALAGHRILRSARPPCEAAGFSGRARAARRSAGARPAVPAAIALDRHGGPGVGKQHCPDDGSTAGGGAHPGELWRHTAPYRGLAAMTEVETRFFLRPRTRNRRGDQGAESGAR